jgi:hypothetical protein
MDTESCGPMVVPVRFPCMCDRRTCGEHNLKLDSLTFRYLCKFSMLDIKIGSRYIYANMLPPPPSPQNRTGPWKIRPIDISWVDWAYKSSTCDAMYRRHSAAIFSMVVKFRNTSWPPPPQFSLHRRAALSSNSNGTLSVRYIAERTQKAVYIVRCLLLGHTA